MEGVMKLDVAAAKKGLDELTRGTLSILVVVIWIGCRAGPRLNGRLTTSRFHIISCSFFKFTHPPETYAVSVSGAGRIIFEAVERLQFLTRAELFFFYTVLRAWFVMSALVSRMERSTIVVGQRLGTVHIMEGTCSRLRFS